LPSASADGIGGRRKNRALAQIAFEGAPEHDKSPQKSDLHHIPHALAFLHLEKSCYV